MSKKAYGSGYFGEWIQDEFGLPAYRYTCDHLNDPKANSPVNEVWHPKNEHLHQVGNDRLVAVASNFGHVQVRQDEGSPKFLNDQDPEHGIYAGGFGYLIDGKTALSTYYPGQGTSFERIFGMGYYQKIVKGDGLVADQVIFAPFGDDPVLISQTKILNNRKEAVDLRWIEYWGCKMYQFSFKSFIFGVISKKTVPEIRRLFSDRFENHFETISNGTGIQATKRFKGDTFSTKIAWAIINFFLATFYRKLTGGRVKRPVKEAVLEDPTPPPTFLISLDGSVDGLETNTMRFFGKGGIISPDGLHEPLPPKIDSNVTDHGLLLERKLHLEPGKEQIISFAYGYLPEGYEIESLISSCQDNLSGLLAQSSEKWKKNRISLTAQEDPWVDRELLWHHYYLRSNLTYDSFFKEHILSQGHIYQYLMGFQGAARDPLQHALPFIYYDPPVVKEIIRYTLKTVRPNGEIPYSIVGAGMKMPAPYVPSDQELWLLWLSSEYVLATRDRAFLEEELPTYPIYGRKAGKARVKELLARCYNHLVNITGTGEHGLQRISNGDWNDGMVHGFVPPKLVREVQKQGESVLNAAMATFVLELYAQLLTYMGEVELAKDTKKRAEAQRKAIRAQWIGKWFKRAWLTEVLGWVGVDELWLEPQPWTIIGGVADAEQRATLIKSIDEAVRQSEKIGARLLDQNLSQVSLPPGMLTNAGVWPSINGTLIWALSLVNGNMSWDEWKKNTLAMHAEAFPDVWYGIWSGPDSYNSSISDYPGQTYFAPTGSVSEAELTFNIKIFWTDFPVMNMHPHAWPLYNLINLMGIKFTVEGIEYAPTLPKEEYRFSSPLVGFEKSKNGYSGWYAPALAGTWKITLKLGKEEIKAMNILEINGQGKDIVCEGENIILNGECTPNKPLRWSIKK